MTHNTVCTSAAKVVIRVGVATETMFESTRIMKNPITIDHRAGQASLGISGGVFTGSP